MTWAIALAGYTLAAFGLAFVLGFSKVLEPMRSLLVPESPAGSPWSEVLLASVAAHHHLTLTEFLELEAAEQRRMTDAAFVDVPSLVRGAPALGAWLYALVTCPPCVGFWTGLAMGALGGIETAHQTHLTAWVWALACGLGLGFFTCSSNLILGRLTGLIPDPNGPP